MENNRRNIPSHSGRSTGELFLTGILKRAICSKSTKASSAAHFKALHKKLQATTGYGDQHLYNSRQFAEGASKNEEFFCYNENEEVEEENGASLIDGSDEDGEIPPGANLFRDISLNVVDFLNERQLGNVQNPISLQPRVMADCYHTQSDLPLKHLLTNQILHENVIKVDNLNKIFCSQWLSDRQVIFGTKCNKLMVVDVQTNHFTQIPSLPHSYRSLPPEMHCGIHSIQLNPSKTLLATGGKNPNDIAVYKLPTLDPLCVGELAHQDWVFSLAWLDDQFLVSGSRDTSLALWKIPEPVECIPSCEFDVMKQDASSIHSKDTCSSYSTIHDLSLPTYSYINSVSVKQCRSAQKIRDVVFNRKLQEIACVSLNGYIHIWAADRFMQKYSRKLPFGLENVCVAVHEDFNLYAVGSKSHTTLMDARTVQCIKKVPSKYTGYGIRSINFFSSLITIGTGSGCILTYDLRAGRYLESSANSARSATLKSSTGWTYPDEDAVVMDFYRQKYTPAIYTHCVDMSGTRIFSAGGPLPISLCGNYIGLWH